MRCIKSPKIKAINNLAKKLDIVNGRVIVSSIYSRPYYIDGVVRIKSIKIYHTPYECWKYKAVVDLEVNAKWGILDKEYSYLIISATRYTGRVRSNRSFRMRFTQMIKDRLTFFSINEKEYDISIGKIIPI